MSMVAMTAASRKMVSSSAPGATAADVCMTLSSVSITTATKSSSAVTVSAVWPKMLCRALFSRRVFPIMAVLETISMPARTRP